jgi:hypothetical protein
MNTSDFQRLGYKQLPGTDTIAAGDQIEWSSGAFISVDPGASLVGQPVSRLPLVRAFDADGRPVGMQTARAFRREAVTA